MLAVGVMSTKQQESTQEFQIQQEDFPALPKPSKFLLTLSIEFQWSCCLICLKPKITTHVTYFPYQYLAIAKPEQFLDI